MDRKCETRDMTRPMTESWVKSWLEEEVGTPPACVVLPSDWHFTPPRRRACSSTCVAAHSPSSSCKRRVVRRSAHCSPCADPGFRPGPRDRGQSRDCLSGCEGIFESSAYPFFPEIIWDFTSTFVMVSERVNFQATPSLTLVMPTPSGEW